MKSTWKRLSTLLLTVVMASMLVLPVMAYEDAEPPIWQQWGFESMEDFMEWNDLETEEEYYEYIADDVEWWKQEQEEETRWQQWREDYLSAHPEYVEELLGISPTVWEEMEYASLEEFMEWNDLATQEEYVDWLVDWYLYDVYYFETAEERRMAERVELGGPAEGIGVMWNGEYVQFTDAQPEIRDERTMVPVRAFMELVGAEVGFDNVEKRVTLILPDGRELQFVAGETTVYVYENDVETTVEMDAAPYINIDRAYVPVRFFSEALGLDVSWDGLYRTAIINDRDALIADADTRFDVINRLFTSGPFDMEQSYELVSEIDGSILLYDSLNGDKTADLSGSATGISKGYNVDMTAQLELSSIFTLVADLVGLDAETKEILELVGDLEMEIIMDAESGMIYVRAPILDTAYEQMELDWEPGTWLAQDIGEILDMIPPEYSMGSLLYEISCANESIYDLDTFNEAVAVLDGFMGDGQFEEKDGGWELVYDMDDVALLYETVLGAYSGPLQEAGFLLRIEENGTYSMSLNFLLDDGEGLGLRFTMDVGSTETGAHTNMLLHIRNVLELELTETETITETDALPRSAPPEGEPVLTEEELWIAEMPEDTLPLDEESLALALRLLMA